MVPIVIGHSRSHSETLGTRSAGRGLNPRPGNGRGVPQGHGADFFFFATLCGLWDLRFSLRDKPQPAAGKDRALTAGQPGNSLEQTRER